MPNIEIKAHYSDLNKGRAIARSLGATHVGLDHQVDTYFRVPQGRLKLRESSLSGAMLIPYLRKNTSGPKKSLFALLNTHEPALVKQILAEMFGIETVVEKNREIFLADNVRIHLDEVSGLGNFLEFEAVYQDASQEPGEYEKVHRLMGKFQVAKEDLIEGSYRERAMSR